MKKFICALLVLVMTSSPVMAMTEAQKDSCNLIIHGAATAAAGSAAALAQLPNADNVALVVLVGGMTIALAEVFDIPLGQLAVETIGAAVIGGFGTIIAARIATQWVVGWVPFLGNAVNSATIVGLVEYIGWSIAEAFDKNKWAIIEVIQAVKTGTLVVSGLNLIELILSGRIVELVEKLATDNLATR